MAKTTGPSICGPKREQITVVADMTKDEGKWEAEYEAEFIPHFIKFKHVTVSTNQKLLYPVALFWKMGNIETVVCMLDGSQGVVYPDLMLPVTDVEFKSEHVMQFVIQRYAGGATPWLVETSWDARIGVVMEFLQK